jgi:predicted ATP-dependent protease
MKKLSLIINYRLLRKTLNPSDLNFITTNEIKPLTEFFGQKRAIEAIDFGIKIKSRGYNLYAMGPSGVGKRSLIKKILKTYASSCPVPPDWCYIHNFENPERPIAIQLPAGYGYFFKYDMLYFVNELGANLLSVFESDEYRHRVQKIHQQFNSRKKRIIKDQNPKEIKTPKLYKEQHNKIMALQLKFTKAIIKPIIKKLKKKYLRLRLPLIVKYLRAVQNDIINNVQDLVKQDETTNVYTFSTDNPALVKYTVNLFVDNRKLKGAPYYFEENPTYSNLICRIEHITTQLGNIVTNFTLIKSGCLPRTNKGFLILEARKLKKNPEAWEALKNALYTKKIKIEAQDPINENIRPISLNPMSIPLDTKIILLGDRQTYYNLCERDAEFNELFKVVVDFDEEINRNKKNIKLYAGLIAAIVHRDKLRPFHATAVAAIIDHSTRLVEDNEKLSTYLSEINDLILEADYWAAAKKRKIVIANDVKQAITAQLHRMDRAKELYYQDILRDFIVIRTSAKIIGQTNCLSVRRVGNYSYGHPTRVSATIRLGKGKLIDIQREIKMAGPFHSKAGLIIANFLSSYFNPKQHFALSASLAFEQVYCWTDGDSASAGELCALLSALAEVPVKQNLAITGSIDQYGKIQAVGGINEKIEGFFDICKAKGLTGQQGVIIPKINKKNLMLREDIVKAAKLNQFSIYAIDHIDEAIALLTDWPAGKRKKNGKYDANTFYHRVEMRLAEFAQKGNIIVNELASEPKPVSSANQSQHATSLVSANSPKRSTRIRNRTRSR